MPAGKENVSKKRVLTAGTSRPNTRGKRKDVLKDESIPQVPPAHTAGGKRDVLGALPFLIGFALPPLIVWCSGRGEAWAFAPLLAIFGVLPALDALSGEGREQSGDASALEANPYFRLVTWLWVPVHAVFAVWAVRTAAAGSLSNRQWRPRSDTNSGVKSVFSCAADGVLPWKGSAAISNARS